ncbi:MAG TPA: bifunctional diguanylate cyclase/phosphodiesterase [Acidimicrobiales bacterium]|nr:bifunctional diguanylate cyclase/phosphodiesterase [Acidimicrobiales bacterium]
MTSKLRPSRDLFIALVVFGATGGLGIDALASQGQRLFGQQPLALAIFALCCLVSELRPLRWLRLDEGGQVTASWTFMMALLLIGPPLAAVSVAAGIVLLSDAVSRKSPVKIAFNTAQIVICLSLGETVLYASGQGQALLGHGAPSWVWLLAFVAACAVIFTTNNALTGTVLALHQGLPVGPMLRAVGTANLSTDGVLLSLSPIFVLVAERSLLLVPLLLLTTWTVYRTAEVALVRKHEATHDALTQLPNRRLFDEHLHNAVLSARRTGGRVGVVLIDLDGFKGINDRLGHDIGDQVLRSIAARMNSARRSTDLLARIGGDEFALVITQLDSVATATQVAERIGATFLQPCVVEGFPVSVEASLGVAVLPDHAQDSQSLLQRADETMYSAKHANQGVVVYGTQSDERPIGRIGLLGDVAEALAAGQFFLEYQPQISLSSGRTVGVEALVRWRHPVAGVLYPSEFIRLAEQTELIGAITRQVLKEALGQAAVWQRAGRDIRVAVNVSARNLQDVHFPEVVADLLASSGAAPHAVDLEITENTVGLDSATIQWALTRLRDIGLSISIDDFGTGYSSMAQLRELPVDRIKIDRSFVTNMGRETRDALIVGSIVQLGLALGIQTVAEGVEDPDVGEMLRQLGCTAAQGWLYGRPMGPDQLDQLWRPAPAPRAMSAGAFQVTPAGSLQVTPVGGLHVPPLAILQVLPARVVETSLQ